MDKVWLIISIIILVLILSMFIWSVVSYSKRCGICKTGDSFPFMEGIMDGYMEFTEYDGVLKDTLLPLCKKVEETWKARGLQVSLIGSCSHKHWTPASNVDLYVEDSKEARALLLRFGAKAMDSASLVFLDGSWGRPVHIYLGDKFQDQIKLSNESRFLLSYLKKKNPDLSFHVKGTNQK